MKTNKQFMILSALGILFVLDDHVGAPIGIFANVFPYNSFYMPCFVFVSGYFFNYKKLTNLGLYLVKKIKTFFIPYIVYNLLYWALMKIVVKLNLVSWHVLSPVEFIKSVFSWRTPVDLTSSSWFVIMLFSVVVCYACLRKILYRIWNEDIMLAVFLVVGCGSVYLSHHGLFDANSVLFIKICFFIQFYQLGIWYKIRVENKVKHINYLYVTIICILINLTIILIYKNNITFTQCAFMQGFLTTNYALSLLSSITGILFWLTISNCLIPICGDNKLINYISDNTLFILMNHMLFYNVLNFHLKIFRILIQNYLRLQHGINI